MSPTDASADAGTAPVTDAGICTNPGPADRRTAFGAGPGVADADPVRGVDTDPAWGSDSEDTLELRLPDELLALIADEASDSGEELCGEERRGRHGVAGSGSATRACGDLLDRVADWGPVATPVGVFHLVPVRAEQDLPLISRWMNDPTVAEFWQLSGARSLAADHVHAQLGGDGRSVPCLGVLDGTPMSYWEIYRADLDPWPATIPPDLMTRASTSSSVRSRTGAEVSAAHCSEPSPTSRSTSALPAPESSSNPPCETPLPSPPS